MRSFWALPSAASTRAGRARRCRSRPRVCASTTSWPIRTASPSRFVAVPAPSHWRGRRRPPRLLAGAEAAHTEIGGTRRWVARMTDQALTAARAKLEPGAFEEAWSQGRKLTAADAVALALD